MILTLVNEEQEFLLETLESYLKDLRTEINRTDNRQFKTRLKQQVEIVQGIIEKLRFA